MSYEKLYNEIYAITALKYFWSGYKSGFIKWESPDWYNARVDFGVEVSQALLPKDGQEESFLRTYLGKRKNQLPPNAFERFGDRLYFYNDRLWALLDDGTHPVSEEEKIITRFSCKLAKLNKNYRHCKTNSLYLFTHTEMDEKNADRIAKKLRALQKAKPHRFDLLFMDCKTTLYVIDFRRGTLDTIPIPEKAAEFLVRKTETLRNTLPQTNGTVYR